MDTVTLRKLTEKSTLKFGKYAEVPIYILMDLKNYSYLRWVYFNNSNITFMDNILAEIGIKEDFRIVKPGKDEQKGKDLDLQRINNRHFKTQQHCKRVAKCASKAKSTNMLNLINKNSSKGVLKAINQGKV